MTNSIKRASPLFGIVEQLAIFLLPLLPAAGISLLILRRFMAILIIRENIWRHTQALTWGGAMVCLVPAYIVGSTGVSRTLLQLGMIFVVAQLLTVRRRLLYRAMFAALLFIVVALIFQRWFENTEWHGNRPGGVEATGLSLEGPVNLIDTRGRRTTATRKWRLVEAPTSLVYSMQLRLISGTPDWEWSPAHVGAEISQAFLSGQSITEITSDDPDGAAAFRTLDTGRQLAGRTFRAQVSIMTEDGISDEKCAGLYMQEGGGEYRWSCASPVIGGSWQEQSLRWTVPADAVTSRLRVGLRNIGSQPVYVKDVVVQELDNGAWSQLDTFAPAGVSVSLSLTGPNQETRRAMGPSFIPTEDWQPYEMSVPEGLLTGADRVTAVMTGEKELQFEVKDVVLAVNEHESKARIILTRLRQELWFGHPNLLGHTAAGIGLLLVGASTRFLPSIISFALALMAVAHTGSRAAWIALILGGLFMILLRVPRLVKWLLPVIVTIAGVIVFLANPASLERLMSFHMVEEATSRPEIWTFAWTTLKEFPWTGLGLSGFDQFWIDEHLDYISEVPTHAHNLWLHFASLHGVWGLLASVWLTSGILREGWRKGRLCGLFYVLGMLIMNTFDVTLLHASVVLPLILGLDHIRCEPFAHSKV